MPNRFASTLRARLLALFLLIFIPVFGYAVYDVMHEFHNRSANAEENLKRLTRLLVQDHQQYIQVGKQTLTAVSHMLDVSREPQRNCSAILTQLTRDLSNFVNFGIASANGEVICTATPVKFKKDISELLFFKDAINTKTAALGPYEIDSQTYKAIVYVGVPVMNAEDKLIYMVFGVLDLSHFDDISPLLQLPEKSALLVLDNRGLILARYPDPFAWTGTTQLTGPLMERISSGINEGFWDMKDMDNIERLYALRSIHRVGSGIDQQNVYIALGISNEYIYNAAIKDLLGKLLTLITVLVLSGLTVWIGGDLLVVQKMRRLIEAAGRVRGGDLQARSELSGGSDEIGQLAEAFDEMAESMKQRVEALQRYGFEMGKFKEMTASLQTCLNQSEVVITARYFAEQLFPDSSGGLYLAANGNEAFQLRAAWGTSELKREFLLEDCWGMRRGRSYFTDNVDIEAHCHHLGEPPPKSYACIPLIGGGEMLGMFHLEKGSPISIDEKSAESLSLAESFTEHVALMLTSIGLRETLHAQAMRDGLTGLFNRRFMEESLNREIRNADRNNSSVALIMADIDHFKRFNDTYGHAAGDELLRDIAAMFQSHLRGGDLACRYGGEEFTIILPGASLSRAEEIAEVLRRGAMEMKIRAQNQLIQSITISLGVASYREHGESWEKVLYAADIALLRAKQRRNAVETYYENS